MYLKKYYAYAYDIANKEAATDNERCKPKEGVSDNAIVGAQCLECSYHLYTLKDNNEQTRNHGEASNANHKY